MATGKVVLLTRGLDKESVDVFMSEKPAGWRATVIDLNDEEKKIIGEVGNAEYILTSFSGPVALKVIENDKNIKLIQTGSQGTEHLPMKWALEKGIPVCNAGGANAISVAEFAVLLMMNSLRQLLPNNQATRDGKFRTNMNRRTLSELYNRTVGVVGFGNIGRRVAKLCYGFGANVLYYERMFVPYALRADMKAKPVTLEELLKQSDLVTMHVPSMASTRRMIGKEQFNMMKPTAYIINTSRGDTIDEAALFNALKEKKIAGAGLDVWDPEPPKPDNPLLKLSNVIATPHIAGVTWNMWQPTCETMWANIVRVSEGKEPINRIREF
jgi:phosphoglycerate dehydrogenase-like enzyme